LLANPPGTDVVGKSVREQARSYSFPAFPFVVALRARPVGRIADESAQKPLPLDLAAYPAQRERGSIVPADAVVSSCTVLPPLPLGDDCMDAGGRATQDAKAEGWGEGQARHRSHKPMTFLLSDLYLDDFRQALRRLSS